MIKSSVNIVSSDQVKNQRHINDYQVLGVLGEGTFGLVLKVVTPEERSKPMALKLLKTWMIPDSMHKNLRKRFELEYLTGRISHPNLVQSYAMDEWKGIPFIIMDLCEGGDLRQRIIQDKISYDQFLSIALGVLNGLKGLHQNGKVHRDLKPLNILFDKHDSPKLTDFGISGHLNIQLTRLDKDHRPEEIFGSYSYMAPEQITPMRRTQTLLPAVDIFSFGVICYELLSRGKYPFGPWQKEKDIPAYINNASRGNIFPHDRIQGKWQKIIYRCLAPKAEHRFQQVDEILDILGKKRKPKSPINSIRGLRVLDGEEPGREYHLSGINRDKRIFSLGRESSVNSNDIQLTEKMSSYISRRHATIEKIRDKYKLRDGQWSPDIAFWIPSKNGTYINGKRIDGSGQLLELGDVITIGNQTLKTI